MIILLSLGYAALLLAAYFWICVRWPPMALAAFFAYSAITKSVSVFYIEQGRWFLSETGIASANIGASWRNLLYNVIIIVAAIAVQSHAKGTYKRTAEAISSNRVAICLSICALALAAQTLNVVTSGMAFSSERHALWQNVKIPILRDALGILVAFVPFAVGACAIYTARQRARIQFQLSILTLAAYFFYLFTSGQGFNGMLTGALLAATPALSLLLAYKTRIPVKRLSILAATGLVILIAASAGNLGQRGIRQFGDGTVVGTIAYRAFVLQGGVYYTADYRVANGAGGRDASILLGGMEETIRALTPGKLAEVYIRKGVNLAGSLPGNAILAFGYWGAIPIVLFYGVVLGLQCRIMMYLLVERRLFALFPASYIMVWIASIYTRGSFEPLTDPKLYAFLLIIGASLMYKGREASSHRLSIGNRIGLGRRA